MYCKNCGNIINDNANFCNHCGAPVQNQSFATPDMGKKEYFDSPYSSEKSKKMITASKILIGILAAVIAFTAFVNIQALGIINTLLNDEDISVTEFLEKLEKLGIENSDIDNGDIVGIENLYELQAIEEELENEFGFSLIEFLKTTIYVTIAVTIGGSILMLLFAFLGVLKLKKGFAVTALVFSVLFSRSWVCIGITIALLVLVNMLNKEYDTYCMSGFAPNNIINEPYFGA